jgi:hypothetical protein
LAEIFLIERKIRKLKFGFDLSLRGVKHQAAEPTKPTEFAEFTKFTKMAVSLSKRIGSFANLSNEAANALRQLNMAGTKYKDDMVRERYPDNEEHPFVMFESYANSKTKYNSKTAPRPTYRGTKKVKAGPLSEDSVEDIPVKKFIGPTSDVKNGTYYIMAAGLHEAHSYYTAHDCKFPENDDVMVEELKKYSRTKFQQPILPFIFAASEILPIDRLVTRDAEIENGIVKCVAYFFNNSDEETPDVQLHFLVQTFLRLVNLIGAYTACINVEKRCAMNSQFFIGILRICNLQLKLSGAGGVLKEETLDSIRDYMAAGKTTKAPSGAASKGKKAKSGSSKPKPSTASRRKSGTAASKKAAPKSRHLESDGEDDVEKPITDEEEFEEEQGENTIDKALDGAGNDHESDGDCDYGNDENNDD